MRALDDLVAAGKVRYVGFSDTPAWKVAQAQTLATLRGWTPLIALQIEYSLLERTVEGELMPMAQELGLGVTPWSPLKAGILSGKYARSGKGTHTGSRGEWMQKLLAQDKTYDVVEAVQAVAQELGTTASRVALAWVRAQPGVTSPILGARTLAQLDDNLAALDVVLSPAQLKKLGDVSRPKLNFPFDFLRGVGPIGYGGTTINGTSFPAYPNSPKSDAERY
jgi:aryl-alcohol dehydrogenase-like predicted oxidoreductase